MNIKLKFSMDSFVSIGCLTNTNTGSYNYNSTDFDLEIAPVFIESESYIGTDCYIKLGVNIGKLGVIGVRSSVFKNLDSSGVYVGSPCVKTKQKVIYE